MSAVRPATSPLRPAVLLPGVALAAALTLVVLRWSGDRGFATDPVGALALAGGAVAADLAAPRLERHARTTAGWLSVALLGHLLAAVWAVGSAVAVAVWNTAGIPPLALAQLTAAAAVRHTDRPARDARLVAAALAAAAVGNLLRTTATDPFAGLPTIAPEAWASALEPVGAGVGVVAGVALLVLPVRLGRAALTSRGAARAGLGIATAAPLVVAFCLLLAVARDPGAVEPELGSIAFLVALAGGSAFAVGCAVAASRGRAGALPAVVRTTLLAVPGLTPRESEVLGLLAGGASNAGIAARLVISECTVDAHLRSVVTTLDLRPDGGTNRRVQAARIWPQHTS